MFANNKFDRVIHLARSRRAYSIENPMAYTQSNWLDENILRAAATAGYTLGLRQHKFRVRPEHTQPFSPPIRPTTHDFFTPPQARHELMAHSYSTFSASHTACGSHVVRSVGSPRYGAVYFHKAILRANPSLVQTRQAHARLHYVKILRVV